MLGTGLPKINLAAAKAFKTVVSEIGKEIWDVWNKNPNLFAVHPAGTPFPKGAPDFRKMFQVEINDANTASVVSGALGIPISNLAAGSKILAGRRVQINQTQLSKQQPNLKRFVATIE
jgi:chromosome partitioning protein